MDFHKTFSYFFCLSNFLFALSLNSTLITEHFTLNTVDPKCFTAYKGKYKSKEKDKRRGKGNKSDGTVIVII